MIITVIVVIVIYNIISFLFIKFKLKKRIKTNIKELKEKIRRT